MNQSSHNVAKGFVSVFKKSKQIVYCSENELIAVQLLMQNYELWRQNYLFNSVPYYFGWIFCQVIHWIQLSTIKNHPVYFRLISNKKEQVSKGGHRSTNKQAGKNKKCACNKKLKWCKGSQCRSLDKVGSQLLIGVDRTASNLVTGFLQSENWNISLFHFLFCTSPFP